MRFNWYIFMRIYDMLSHFGHVLSCQAHGLYPQAQYDEDVTMKVMMKIYCWQYMYAVVLIGIHYHAAKAETE